MFEKINSFVLKTPFLSGLINTIQSTITKQLDKLKETLSESAYSNIEGMLNKIAGISLILLSIYIVYSIFSFIYALIFQSKVRIKILISTAIAIPILLIAYAVYAYIHIG